MHILYTVQNMQDGNSYTSMTTSLLKQTPGLLKYYNPTHAFKLLEAGIEPYNLSAPENLVSIKTGEPILNIDS